MIAAVEVSVKYESQQMLMALERFQLKIESRTFPPQGMQRILIAGFESSTLSCIATQLS